VCVLLIVMALTQTTLSPRLAILGVQPNLMLLVVLCWSLLRGAKEGMLWAFGGGVLLDMLSAAPFGTWTLSLVLVSFFSGLGEVAIFRASLSPPLVVGFFGSLLHDVAFLTILQLMGRGVDWPTSLWRLVFPAAALNMALMPVVYLLLRWLDRRTKEAELAW